MAGITTLFFDVGGVLLTNGWDRSTRRRAAERFHLDWDTLEERHELVVADFETGRLSLDAYLDCTVFHDPRPFSREEFKAFIFAQSQADPDALAVVEALAAAGNYLLATLNNESAELNAYRIRQFQFRRYFTVFFTSCYLGLRKPDPKIYRLALDLTQRTAAECLFVDDRALNVDSARAAGMRAIRFENAAQLRREMTLAGVAVGEA
jgi:putative hydrolase of the HAD superfamily